MKIVFSADGCDFQGLYYSYNKCLETKQDYLKRTYVCCPQCNGKILVDRHNNYRGKCDCGCGVEDKYGTAHLSALVV